MFFFFFFKQKTAYEMRISDWSSDVCSSDLTSAHFTLYALTLDPADPTRYKVGGTWLKMAKATVAITIKDDDGGLKTQSHDFWRTIYGPVVDRKSTRLNSSH